MIGTTIGPYHILGKLGEGGMGEVYRARDTHLGRDVAIKVLPASVAGDPDRLARFDREARTLAALNHPNIAQIYGLEKSLSTGHGQPGTTALVMELVEGPTLAERIAQGPIPLEEALPIAKQIAEALEAAHEQGIVHRDLKPANIKIQGAWGPTPTRSKTAPLSVDSRPRVTDGTVKVLDFGLAKAMEPAAAAAPDLTASPTITTPAMTRAGVILGTAAYMSPEQARGQPVDVRADVWAFGCVLFEMLTGRGTFQGPTVSDVLAGILRAEPDWDRLPGDLHPRIRLLLERCLEKSQADRYHSIADARVDVQKVLTDPAGVRGSRPASISPAGSRSSLAWVMGVTTAAVATAAVLLLALVGLPDTAALPGWAAAPVRFSLYPPDGTTFDEAGGFAVSPDGRFITFPAVSADGSVQLWLRSLDADDARPLAGTEDGMSPFWSPDGEWIGFFVEDALKRVRAMGGEPPQTVTRVVAQAGLLHGAWGAGDVIVFQTGAGRALSQVSVRDGTVTPATVLRGDSFHFFPTFIGDSRRFLYRKGAALEIGSLDGEASLPLLESATATGSVPGYLLYAERGAGLFARPFDEDALEFSGDAIRILDEVPMAGTGRVPVSLSSNGVLVYRTRFGGALAQFRWADRNGVLSSPLIAPEWYGGQFASWDLGPDGEQVAVRRLDEGAGGTLWIRNLVRGDERVVTQDGDSMNPIWSPAGDSLVFASARGRPPDLFRTVLRDGTEELLTGGPAAMFPQSWDPTRDWIVYAFGDPQSGGDLWRLSLEDGGIEPLPLNTGFDEGDGQVSPDGRWIAYVSNASGERRVVLAGFPSGQPRCPVSVGGGSVPRWRADGRELYYVSAGRQLMAVEVAPGDEACLLGSPEPLFPLPDESNDDLYAPASDGQRFLFLTRAEDADVLPLRVILNWPALAEE